MYNGKIKKNNKEHILLKIDNYSNIENPTGNEWQQYDRGFLYLYNFDEDLFYTIPVKFKFTSLTDYIKDTVTVIIKKSNQSVNNIQLEELLNNPRVFAFCKKKEITNKTDLKVILKKIIENKLISLYMVNKTKIYRVIYVIGIILIGLFMYKFINDIYDLLPLSILFLFYVFYDLHRDDMEEYYSKKADNKKELADIISKRSKYKWEEYKFYLLKYKKFTKKMVNLVENIILLDGGINYIKDKNYNDDEIFSFETDNVKSNQIAGLDKISLNDIDFLLKYKDFDNINKVCTDTYNLCVLVNSNLSNKISLNKYIKNKLSNIKKILDILESSNKFNIDLLRQDKINDEITHKAIITIKNINDKIKDKIKDEIFLMNMNFLSEIDAIEKFECYTS